LVLHADDSFDEVFQILHGLLSSHCVQFPVGHLRVQLVPLLLYEDVPIQYCYSSLTCGFKDDDFAIGVAKEHGDVVILTSRDDSLELGEETLSLEQQDVPSVSDLLEVLQINVSTFPEFGSKSRASIDD